MNQYSGLYHYLRKKSEPLPAQNTSSCSNEAKKKKPKILLLQRSSFPPDFFGTNVSNRQNKISGLQEPSSSQLSICLPRGQKFFDDKSKLDRFLAKIDNQRKYVQALDSVSKQFNEKFERKNFSPTGCLQETPKFAKNDLQASAAFKVQQTPFKEAENVQELKIDKKFSIKPGTFFIQKRLNKPSADFIDSHLKKQFPELSKLGEPLINLRHQTNMVQRKDRLLRERSPFIENFFDHIKNRSHPENLLLKRYCSPCARIDQIEQPCNGLKEKIKLKRTSRKFSESKENDINSRLNFSFQKAKPFLPQILSFKQHKKPEKDFITNDFQKIFPLCKETSFQNAQPRKKEVRLEYKLLEPNF